MCATLIRRHAPGCWLSNRELNSSDSPVSRPASVGAWGRPRAHRGLPGVTHQALPIQSQTNAFVGAEPRSVLLPPRLRRPRGAAPAAAPSSESADQVSSRRFLASRGGASSCGDVRITPAELSGKSARTLLMHDVPYTCGGLGFAPREPLQDQRGNPKPRSSVLGCRPATRDEEDHVDHLGPRVHASSRHTRLKRKRGCAVGLDRLGVFLIEGTDLG